MVTQSYFQLIYKYPPDKRTGTTSEHTYDFADDVNTNKRAIGAMEDFNKTDWSKTPLGKARGAPIMLRIDKITRNTVWPG